MGRRGNPNWIRAGEARRRLAEAAPVDRAAENDRLPAVLGPAVGAIAGGLAITLGADRFGLDPERTALGAAVLGVVTALSSTGWIRAIASAVAAAGIAMAIAQRLAPEAKAPTREDVTEPPEQPQPIVRSEGPEPESASADTVLANSTTASVEPASPPTAIGHSWPGDFRRVPMADANGDLQRPDSSAWTGPLAFSDRAHLSSRGR